MLRTFMVDLNGDGIPDATVQAPAGTGGVMQLRGDAMPAVSNRERGQIQRRAMAGREPTQQQQGWLDADMPRLEAGSNRLAGLTNIPQTGQAISEAYQDPSIANVTNAGVNTLMTGFRPMAALGVLGAGYGAAAASDLMDSAQAAPAKRQAAQPQPVSADLPGLNPQQMQEYNQIQFKLSSGTFGSSADRRQTEARAKELRGISDTFSQSRNTSAQAEYDNSVRRAETIRDTILADRPKRFSETAIGEVYDKTGIMSPLLLAAGAGGLSRSASGGGTFMRDYGAPAAIGTLTGGIAANYPLGHELMFAPAANPERQAFEAYARELPPDHPRKAEWQSYARGLPEANPARAAASAEFYDPMKFAERTGLGAVEGLIGGLAGSEMIRVGSRLTGRSGGAKAGAANDGSGPPPPPPNSFGDWATYPPVGSPQRDAVREGYRGAVIDAGGPLKPSSANRIIQNEVALEGGTLPSVTGRVKETNAAIQQFIAQNGRMPVSRQEWEQFIFMDTRTLGAVGAAGIGANSLMQGYSGQE